MTLMQLHTFKLFVKLSKASYPKCRQMVQWTKHLIGLHASHLPDVLLLRILRQKSCIGCKVLLTVAGDMLYKAARMAVESCQEWAVLQRRCHVAIIMTQLVLTSISKLDPNQSAA